MIEWEVHADEALSFNSGEYIAVVNGGAAEYGGDYAVTPSAETQTLPTEGTIMAADLVINPIPSNYGLITYDGSIITVS